MNPVQITNGKENPSSGESSLIIYVNHERKDKFLGDMVGRPLEHGAIMKVTEPIFEPALAGHKPEIAGKWVTQTFLIPNETILVVSANKRQHWRDGGRPARLILRVREKAALRQVEFTTLQLSVSTRGTVNAVKGRFDVLSLEEAKKIGFVPNPMHLDQYTQESIVTHLRTQILERELEVKPSVQHVQVATIDGQTEKVILTTRRRTL